MIEPADPSHQRVEDFLARMAERRVAEIMRKRHGLGEVLIQAQRTGDGTRQLANFDRMGEPRPVMIALVRDEDLRLVRETPKGRRVDDAVPVTLEVGPRGGAGLRQQSA